MMTINKRTRTVSTTIDGVTVSGTYKVKTEWGTKVVKLGEDFKAAAAEACGVNIEGISQRQAMARICEAAKICMMAEGAITEGL